MKADFFFLLLGTLRKEIPSKKGSWWQPFLHSALSHKLHFTEKSALNFLPWTVCLHYVSAIWVSFYKGVTGILFQPIVLKLSRSNRSYVASTNQSGFILTNQGGAFWTKLWGFGVLICLRTDQSGTRGGNLCLFKPAPLWLLDCYFPFHPRLKSAFSIGWAETLRGLTRAKWSIPVQARTDQHRAEQTSRTELSSQAGTWLQDRLQPWSFQGRAISQAVRQPGCFHSPAVSQLSCFALNKMSSFTTPQIGDSCWHWIGSNNHHRFTLCSWDLWKASSDTGLVLYQVSLLISEDPQGIGPCSTNLSEETQYHSG